jgi:hypothetical protein
MYEVFNYLNIKDVAGQFFGNIYRYRSEINPFYTTNKMYR